MSRIIDNVIAFRILKMLVTPFKDTDAHKLGIIDDSGKVLKKMNTLKTTAEREAYNYLTRLIFGLKRLINKLPGGEVKLKTLVAALWLVREQYENNNKLPNAVLQEKFDELIKMMDNRVSLVEEEILVNKFLKEDGVANVTGAAVSTDQPKISKKQADKYKNCNSSLMSMTRRSKPVEV